MFCPLDVLKILLICRAAFGNIVRSDDFIGDELFLRPLSDRVVAAKSDDVVDGVRSDDFAGDEFLMAPESDRVVAAKSDDAEEGDVEDLYDAEV